MGLIKGFIFDGIDSHLYGLGLTGKDVYNAPERDVEMVVIPGRDGEFARDKKRFSNIDITYHAGTFDSNQPDFARRMSDLRNALASRIGYKRLEDEYNVNEYRMGIYKSGFETEPVHYSRAGEFDIVFSCMPQRFLKSGEEETAIADNQQIFNPTPYAAKPLLKVKGYGSLNVGDKTINLDNTIPLGQVVVADRTSKDNFLNLYVNLRPLLANGDAFDVSVVYDFDIEKKGSRNITGITADKTIETPAISSSKALVRVPFTASFTSGTTSTGTQTAVVTVASESGGSTYTNNFNIVTTIAYDATTQKLTISNTQMSSNSYFSVTGKNKVMNEVTAYSTASALGNPTYIDLDIGEAYKVDNGQIVSVNNAVSLGGELPTLAPGSTLITYDNTITEVKITPRWWIL